MWSFDRYQRWIDQKRDWVKPSQATQVLEDSEPVTPARLPPLASPAPRAPQLSAKKTSGPQQPSSAGASTKRLEIQIEEEDLEALAQRISEEEEGE